MKKRILIGFLLLLLLSTYNLKNLKSNKFLVKEIIIENNIILSKIDVKNELSFLYEKNIFLLNNKQISENLGNNSLIESLKVKKIYPDKLLVKIFEKKPIAILQNKKRKFYYTDKNDTIDYFELREIDYLPIVFGDKDNFKIFYQDLKNINFPVNEIKKFYFFETKRWDLVTENEQIVKLPPKNYEESLKNFLNLMKKEDFKKFKLFDYRIKEQLILK